MSNSRNAPSTKVMRYSDWQFLDARLVWIYEGFPAIQSGQFRSHHGAAWLLTKGHLAVTGAKETRHVGPRSWVFVPTSRYHHEFSSDASILSIRFILTWPSQQNLFNLPEPMDVPAADHPELETKARVLLHYIRPTSEVPVIRSLAHQPMELTDYVRLNSLFLDWAQAFSQLMLNMGVTPTPSNLSDPRVSNALHYLENHPMEQPLDLGKAAREAGLSQGQLDRLFRKQFGLSMRGHYDERRHSTAVFDLTRSPLQIKEIAFRLGFKDVSAFSHWFRKWEGCSPRDFRQNRP